MVEDQTPLKKRLPACGVCVCISESASYVSPAFSDDAGVWIQSLRQHLMQHPKGFLGNNVEREGEEQTLPQFITPGLIIPDFASVGFRIRTSDLVSYRI